MTFPPAALGSWHVRDSAGFTLRFRRAVPLAAAEQGAGSQSKVAGKKSQKKHKQSVAASSTAAPVRDNGPLTRWLKPADIPRVRLFLCLENDIKGGQLPQLHVELDPCESLHVAVMKLQSTSRSSKLAPSKPHTGHQWYPLPPTPTQRMHPSPLCSFVAVVLFMGFIFITAVSLFLQYLSERLRCFFATQNRQVPLRALKSRFEHFDVGYVRDSHGPHWSCCDQLVSLGNIALRCGQRISIPIDAKQCFFLPHCPFPSSNSLFYRPCSLRKTSAPRRVLRQRRTSRGTRSAGPV